MLNNNYSASASRAFSGNDLTAAAESLQDLYPGIAEVRIITRRLYDRPIYTIRVFTSPKLGTVRVAHARSRNPYTAAQRIVRRVESDADFLYKVKNFC